MSKIPVDRDLLEDLRDCASECVVAEKYNDRRKNRYMDTAAKAGELLAQPEHVDDINVVELIAEPVGEEVEVLAWRIGFPNGAGFKVYEQRQPWAYESYGDISYQVDDLMTVTQHQRIVDGLRAELDGPNPLLAEVSLEALKLVAQLDEVVSALPGVRFMDLPDGGSVSIGEQVLRMAQENEALRAQLAQQQQVVLPERMKVPSTRTLEAYGYVNGWNDYADEYARINSKPIQQEGE